MGWSAVCYFDVPGRIPYLLVADLAAIFQFTAANKILRKLPFRSCQSKDFNME